MHLLQTVQNALSRIKTADRQLFPSYNIEYISMPIYTVYLIEPTVFRPIVYI